MRTTRRAIVHALIISALPAWKATAGPAMGQPVHHPFSISQDPDFAAATSVLQRLVDQQGTSEVNHFCVLGQELESGERQAWVYWLEHRAIILWEPPAQGMADLILSRRYLRLDQDVVPDTDGRLATSSYLVPLTWARGLIAECTTQGTRFIVRRSTGRSTVGPPLG